MKSGFLLAVPTLLTAWFAYADDLRRVEMTANDGVFAPAEITMAAGEKIILEVRNIGKEAEEFESAELKREKIVPPGKTITVPLGPLKPGSYPFFGEFHPKTARGRVIVTEAK